METGEHVDEQRDSIVTPDTRRHGEVVSNEQLKRMPTGDWHQERVDVCWAKALAPSATGYGFHDCLVNPGAAIFVH
jgi:hypothetical protein